MEHIQLNRAQYTALYRLARLNKQTEVIGCFDFVEASYRQIPIDWLAFRESRYNAITVLVDNKSGIRKRLIFISSHNAMRHPDQDDVRSIPALYNKGK